MATAVVVGGGRVGQALLSMGPSSGDLLLRRGEALPPAAPAGPSSSAPATTTSTACSMPPPNPDGKVPNRPLALVISLMLLRAELTMEKIADLVFFQNGMLDPWLESKGLAGANQNQVLAYFAVSKLGEPPVDGITEGLTAAFGNWAPAVAARLQSGGLTCKVLDKDAFQKQTLEKLIWISAFMFVG